MYYPESIRLFLESYINSRYIITSLPESQDLENMQKWLTRG